MFFFTYIYILFFLILIINNGDIMITDYSISCNKNEVTLIYTPSLKKYAESLKFELGVAQSYYQTGKQSSSVELSTGFKL